MSLETPSRRVAIIADDEDLGRLLLSEALSASGLETLCFDNGADALEAALRHDVAIVLLDVDMPRLNGYAVCRRLRAEPRFDAVPIVMVTGHEDAAAIGLAFDAGATDFISKPVNWALLPRRLAYILRNAASAERIERLAYYDVLTGLPNRQCCLDTAERMLAAAAGLQEEVAVVYMDLNSFKKVNDTFGHAVGDVVLCRVAGILTRAVEALRPQLGDVALARFGGDEFVVVLRSTEARAAAGKVGSACLESLKSPIAHDGLEFYTAPSVGVAVYPEDGLDVPTLLKHADIAMYQAKAGLSAAVVTFTPAMSSRLRERLDLEGRLRRAILEDGLRVHYQPKFATVDNRLVGVEALLRWHDAEHGEIPPTRFIEIAEESGLIIELGHWTLKAVCRQLRDWQDRGIAIPVAVNVSGKELLHGDPARMLEAEAVAAGVPTQLIEVEITESILVNDSAAVRSALQKMRSLGCRIALDDFGTGYSSLAYITRFPPDRIKIDKAFVRNLDRSPSDAAVASAILSMGSSLGVTVTAEGIERLSQFEWLKRRGCQEIQGFLLSMPLTAEELEVRFLSGEAPAVTHRAAMGQISK
jgi:diguanylate cyclase (GGDEF)-like protein